MTILKDDSNDKVFCLDSTIMGMPRTVTIADQLIRKYNSCYPIIRHFIKKEVVIILTHVLNRADVEADVRTLVRKYKDDTSVAFIQSAVVDVFDAGIRTSGVTDLDF